MPNIKNKLLYANVLIYGAIVIVCLVFSTNIVWGKKTIEAYVVGKPLLPSADSLMIKEAGENLQKKQKVEESKELLEKARVIDPYSNAGVLLGICHLAQGDTDKMIEVYQQYLSINPSYLGAYIQLIRVFSQQQQYEKIDKLLDDGIKYFQKRSVQYKPHFDNEVEQQFNDKAAKIHNESLQAINYLIAIKEQIAKQRQAGEINDK